MDDAAKNAGDFRVYSPFHLSSFALVHTSTSNGRKIIAEARQIQGRQVQYGGTTYSLRISIQKTKEERDRNRRLVKIAAAVQNNLRRETAEAKKEAWQLVCWRTATVVVAGKRTAVLSKDHETLKFSSDDWWRNDIYGAPKAEVERCAKVALDEDLGR